LPEQRRKHVPARTCIACRQKRAKRELVRVVRTPEQTIELDLKGKRAGRGAYLCRDPRCWETALAQNKLGHALKCQISAEDVERLRAFAATLPADQPSVEAERP
jgi:predicted RNA-binding protein YlxR (DUF448 family)